MDIKKITELLTEGAGVSGNCHTLTQAKELLEKYADVRKEDSYIRIYDVDDTASIVDYLMKNGYVVSEISRNKIGLEEYYIELMSKKEAE